MDAEVARTLGELEQKLLALERTLAALGHSPQAPPERPAPADDFYAPPPPDPPPPLADPPPAARHPQLFAGRIVDEAVERPGARGAAPRRAAGQQPEPPSPPPPPRAPQQPSAAAAPRQPPPPASVAPQQPAAAPAQAPGQAADASLRPSAVELLRFRERLASAGRELTHEYDELLLRLSYAAMPAGGHSTISFARGVPSLDIIDVDGLRDAAVRAFESDPEGTTAYGTAVGYPRLRAWIADRHGVEPDRVLVTNGSLQADAFLFDHLIAHGDEVVVESPTYDRTLLGLKERGALVHAVDLQHDGIDTEALAALLADGARPRLAHVIPNFQNPAGYTLSLAKRRALLALAAQHGFVVLEDDPYSDLRFSGEPQPTMLSLDGEHVVYASSFTKTVCPGVRVGYLVGPRELIAGIARRATNTYISPGMVSEAIVYEFCASGALDRSIETVRAALAERARTLGDALRRDLPEAEFVAPQGGYFMWVTLPTGTDVNALFEAAAERGVAFVKGTDFMLEGGENALRLAYSGVTPEQIEAGVTRLAEAYRSL